METAAWTFASSVAPPRIEDLYGAAGGARVGEPLAFALEMEQLEREERAFAASVLALVHRSAPEPIGAKFHREHARPGELGGIRGQLPMGSLPGRGSSIGSGRGAPFPPSQFSVDESSTDSISIGLHERADSSGVHHEDAEEEDAEEEEEEEDMDEGETDDDDAFTAEEDHDDDDMDMDSFDRAMDAAAPDSSGADGSTPLDASSRPQW